MAWATAWRAPPLRPGGRLADADEPAAMIGLAASGPPDGLTSTSSPRPSAAHQHLLVGEGAQLGHVDRAVAHPARSRQAVEAES